MKRRAAAIDRFDRQALARFVLDLLERAVLHHGLWFTEVRHQMGTERALELLREVAARSLEVQLARLSKTFGFETEGGLPKAWVRAGRDDIQKAIGAFCGNWVANDGLWFQAIESAEGMNDAKRCNDSVWAQFAPIEAAAIKRLLDLPPRPGLAGLKQALAYRMYSLINSASLIDEGPASFVFRMDVCRVHAARLRRGLAEYSCKSAGLVEYSYFARAVDDRIRTECVGCPPEPHPPEWFCAWRFTLEEPRRAP